MTIAAIEELNNQIKQYENELHTVYKDLERAKKRESEFRIAVAEDNIEVLDCLIGNARAEIETIQNTHTEIHNA